MAVTLDAVSDARARLACFGPVEAIPGGAPVYARLAHAASEDDELVALLAHAPPSQRRATLFFASIHFLLLQEEGHPLGAWFSSRQAPSDDPEPVFREFCLERADALRGIFATRKTQTNEVQRSSYLLPAFGLVSALARQPLALIEPGAAAGLNLLCDKYFFDYGAAGAVGDPSSVVRIEPELKGPTPPPVPASMPEISSRVGIDLEPVDVFDDDAVRWLRACVWAEHHRRGELFNRAIEVARAEPPQMISGDAIEVLPSVLEKTPRDAAACVFHTNVLPYFNSDQIKALVGLLRAASAEREIYWIASEGWSLIVPMFQLEEPPRLPDTEYSMLAVLTTVKNGNFRTRLLARAAPHGHWIQWLDGQKIAIADD